MVTGPSADLGYVSIDARRSVRLPMAIPVEISYTDQSGQPCLERTQTKDVDRHGARFTSRSSHQVGSKINLGITHLGRSAHCRVVWCSAPTNGSYEVGVELETPENVWGVPFESAAWHAGLDPAAALWTIAQVLEEQGIMTREQLRDRILGNVAPGPPGPPARVPSWMNRHV
jgi:hypothetical protein